MDERQSREERLKNDCIRFPFAFKKYGPPRDKNTHPLPLAHTFVSFNAIGLTMLDDWAKVGEDSRLAYALGSLSRK